jgi:hypothetical protein
VRLPSTTKSNLALPPESCRVFQCPISLSSLTLLSPGPATELIYDCTNLAAFIRRVSCEERSEDQNADEKESLHALSSNEKEISHGTVS